MDRNRSCPVMFKGLAAESLERKIQRSARGGRMEVNVAGILPAVSVYHRKVRFVRRINAKKIIPHICSLSLAVSIILIECKVLAVGNENKNNYLMSPPLPNTHGEDREGR